ncbi:hypothetical protein [Microbispora sp. NPDC049633]|uniref:hypothetical protein n=1 Tax=Microbispora sp. NPDC049633 TaxID=3154355 RepID=UPI003423268F
MPLRVAANVTTLGREVDIYVGQADEVGELTKVLQFDTAAQARTWVDVENGAVVKPTITLNYAEANLLLDELSKALGGSSNLRLLQDQVSRAESRVDRLINGLIEHKQVVVSGGQVRGR